jgi:hypothetical protein
LEWGVYGWEEETRIGIGIETEDREKRRKEEEENSVIHTICIYPIDLNI